MKDFLSNKVFFLILYLDMFFMSTEEFDKKYPIVEED